MFNLPGQTAVLALGVPELLAGTATWTPATAERAAKLLFRWRSELRLIVAGDIVDEPDVPERPATIPTSLPPIVDAPPELDEAVTELLLALSPLDDVPATDSPVGPLPRPVTAYEAMRFDILWRTLAAPETVLADASRGALSYAQLEHMEAVFPAVLDTWRKLLTAEMARAKPEAPLPKVRHAVAMLMVGRGASEPPTVDVLAEEAPGAPGTGAPPVKPGEGSASREGTQAQETESR